MALHGNINFSAKFLYPYAFYRLYARITALINLWRGGIPWINIKEREIPEATNNALLVHSAKRNECSKNYTG
jgi:hypothetical protein